MGVVSPLVRSILVASRAFVSGEGPIQFRSILVASRAFVSGEGPIQFQVVNRLDSKWPGCPLEGEC